jgi:hypothetical protein
VPGTLVMILVPILVKIDKPDLTLLKGADYLGMVLMALSLGCLQYVLEEGARWDWLGDDTIRICAWIAGLAGIGFIIRSMTFARPVVDLRALANRRYCGMGRGQGTPRGVTSPLFGERRPLPVPRISAKRNRWRQHDASVFVA